MVRRTLQDGMLSQQGPILIVPGGLSLGRAIGITLEMAQAFDVAALPLNTGHAASRPVADSVLVLNILIASKVSHRRKELCATVNAHRS